MILSDSDIKEAISRGDVIISPFSSSHLKNTMYDVSLGEFYYEPSSSETFSVSDQEGINRYWGSVQSARPARELGNFDSDRPAILLRKKQMILAHTLEFIGSTSKSLITTSMSARSTIGRCGIRTCACAGLGDVGYFNRWTMEIENVSDADILIYVGTRIASISFLTVSSPSEDLYSKRGSYTLDGDLAHLQESWKPEMMIPRAT